MNTVMNEEQRLENASLGNSFELVDTHSATSASYSLVNEDEDRRTANSDEDSDGKEPSRLSAALHKLDLQGPPAKAERQLRPGETAKNDLLPFEAWSQRSTPGSSNKPPSLDGKSVMSGATFALDEKESLRPDDSASTRAIEEDESFSGPGSAVGPSQVGSEVGDRAFREQFYKVPERVAASSVSETSKDRLQSLPEHEIGLDPAEFGRPKLLSARSGDSVQGTASPFGFYEHGPDEKLLEAMDSPKDRLFLLRVERDIISFINESTTPTLDLPPQNSFYRLLSHKLADYYCLTHVVDNTTFGIRLFRTPYCRVPPSLSSFPSARTASDTPPLNAVKIMSRAQLKKQESISQKSSAPSSVAGSATVEETGDGFFKGEATLSSKDKSAMTREEREAAYEAARARIFKDFKEKPSDEDQSSTDANASEKSAGKSKKQRSADDDAFEARTQFVPYYASYPGYGYAQSYPYHPNNEQYAMNGAYSGAPPQNGSNLMQPFAPSQGTFNHFSQYPEGRTNGSIPNQSPLSTKPKDSPQPPYGFAPYGPPGTQSGYAESSLSASTWHQGASPQAPFPPKNGSWSKPSYQTGPQGPMPYAYGQVPMQPSGMDTSSLHSVSGGYGRPSFNPQSSSFIPGRGYPMQGNLPQFQPSYNAGRGFPIPQPRSFTDNTTSYPPQGMPVPQDSIAKWGNPSHLPPKPPPPAAVYRYDVKTGLTPVTSGSSALPTGSSDNSLQPNGQNSVGK